MGTAPDLDRLLAELGVEPGSLLGRGGEAVVYALDDQRVVRISHGAASVAAMRDRAELFAELAAAAQPFGLPVVDEVRETHGVVVTIERRLRGIPLADALASIGERHGVERAERAGLIEAYLDAVARLGDLPLRPRLWFGHLVGDAPLRASTWREFLTRKAENSLAMSGFEACSVDPWALAGDLPACDDPRFVHLDAFAGNVLVERSPSGRWRVSAVIDMGAPSVAGDRRLDPVTAVVYLASSAITPTATAVDVDVARAWLQTAGLAALEDPVRCWIAAYWSFARDDVALHDWCRSVLMP